MRYTDFIKKLDHKSRRERLEMVFAWLDEHQVAYRRQEYPGGTNLVVDLGAFPLRLGIGSHFDIVEESGGANDNGSAIAVCLNIIGRFKEKGHDGMGLRIFFFDEEETGLKGSAAYIQQYGVNDLTGLLNLELVGMGDKFALWPVSPQHAGSLLRAFERCARKNNIDAIRFDKIITNTADHLSFRDAGLADAFTITCISAKDLEAAGRYYKALERGAGRDLLFNLLSQAPVFAHYHQPTDTWDTLEEGTILMTANTIWDTITG